MHILVFCHVENVARNQQAIEAVQVEEAEEVYQEQQSQEFEVADQAEEQTLETDFANPTLQQGKHRFMLNPESLHYVQVLLLVLTCALWL